MIKYLQFLSDFDSGMYDLEFLFVSMILIILAFIAKIFKKEDDLCNTQD